MVSTALSTPTWELNRHSSLGNTQLGERESAWAQGRIKYEHSQAMCSRRGGEERQTLLAEIGTVAKNQVQEIHHPDLEEVGHTKLRRGKQPCGRMDYYSYDLVREEPSYMANLYFESGSYF